MSTSTISLASGQMKQLDGKAQPDEVVKPDDAADTTKLARLLTRLLSLIATVQRAYVPRTIIFRDVTATGIVATPVTITLAHKLGGQVDWWPVRVRGLNPSVSAPIFVETANDGQTLTLSCYGTGTFDLLVREAG